MKTTNALSFEQAEFYTLQEASNYLNLKHGINNITPKKLIKAMAKYDINAYVFIKDLDLYFDIFPDRNHAYTEEDSDKSFIDDSELTNNLELVLSEIKQIAYNLNFYTYYFGLLIQITDVAKEILFFRDINYIYDTYAWKFFSTGVLSLDGIDQDPHSLEFIQKHEELENCIITSIQPNPDFFGDCDTCDEDFRKVLNKLKEVPDTDKMTSLITLDDVIILHKDLINLEENIINNNPPVEKQTDTTSRKIGVSIQKLQAKKIARMLAKALWRYDKDKVIKIGDMASKVYAELYESDFQEQLPDNQNSLKEWIKDVAPDYAREGGRPPKSNT